VTPDPRLQAVRAFFEGLQPQDVARMGELYSEHCYFRDPFNEVRGLPAVQRVFAHMFETLVSARFVVREAFADGDQAFLSWDFLLRLKGQPNERRIHGSSHLRFAPDGRVVYHRDYWDAAEEVWEKVPLLGAVLRTLKKRLRA